MKLRKDYQLQVQFAYLVNFALFLLLFAHFTFLYYQWVLHSLESLFSLIHLHFVLSYLVYNLQLVGS